LLRILLFRDLTRGLRESLDRRKAGSKRIHRPPPMRGSRGISL
jgi:hypothetical protein